MTPASLLDWTILGGCYAAPPMRAVFCEKAALARWVAVERAIARAQGELDIIPPASADAIDRTLDADRIDLERLQRDTGQVGRPIVGLARQLAEQVGEAHAPWVHYGITTYDVMDSGTVLGVKEGLALVRSRLEVVRERWEALAEGHRDTLMIGRTNGQHAQPTTFGARVATWLEEFVRHQERLDAAAGRALVLQLGGMVGSLASVDPRGLALREKVAQTLGLGVPVTNWHNARDGLAEVAQALGLVCASLARIAHDLSLLGSTDIAEVYEAGPPGRGQSSGMPHKRNPRACEFAEAVARLGRQRAAGVTEVMGQEHERSGGAYIAEWLLVPEVFLLASGAIKWMIDLTSRLQIDPARMRANLEATRGMMLSERYTLFLARCMDKREARRLLDAACARVHAEDIGLREALEASDDVMQHVTPAELDLLSDPATYLGSAGEMVDRAVALSRAARS